MNREIENSEYLVDSALMQEPASSYGRSFKDLDCWKASSAVRQRIRQLTASFPESEKYLLVQQVVRSSRSASANIAEGYGRFHYKENIQFCRQARGSLYETLDHLTVAVEEGYIDSAQYDEMEQMIIETVRILNGYINYLIKQLEAG